MASVTSTPTNDRQLHAIDDKKKDSNRARFESFLREQEADVKPFEEWMMAVTVERIDQAPRKGTWYPGRVHVGTLAMDEHPSRLVYAYLRRTNTEEASTECCLHHATIGGCDIVPMANGNGNNLSWLPWATIVIGRNSSSLSTSRITFAVKITLAYNSMFDGSLTIDNADAEKRKKVLGPVVTNIWRSIQSQVRSAEIDDASTSSKRSSAETESFGNDRLNKKNRVGDVERVETLDISAIYSDQQKAKEKKIESLEAALKTTRDQVEDFRQQNCTLKKEEEKRITENEALKRKNVELREVEKKNTQLSHDNSILRDSLKSLHKERDDHLTMIKRHEMNRTIIVNTLKAHFVRPGYTEQDAEDKAIAYYEERYTITSNSTETCGRPQHSADHDDASSR